VTIVELNACDRNRFVDALGWIFEGSPWVAERAWTHRPFDGVAELHTVMIGEVVAATAQEQLALLRAHPDLGTRARMSDASVGEQAGAGLDRLTPEEFDRLQRLTSTYREKFGFPFLLAVKGRSTRDVLDALEARIGGSPDDERAEALAQVSRIAGWRLHDLIR
jgi:2-oxo-4-hydroxy-4-carboxy-5-ureidoimidazoline decarboxylase